MANFTKLLLHCDGADASTTFTDSSIYAKTVTAAGNAQVDTAQKKFGTGAYLGDGTSDGLTSADSADWDFGTGDFTIDFWIRFADASPGRTYLYDRTPMIFWFESGGTINFYNGASNFLSRSWAPTQNTWYHLAWVRSSGTNFFFVDGVQQGATASDSTSYTGTAAIFVMYNQSAGNSLNGHMDEFRISTGIARWTSNFTPPSAAYEISSTSSSSSSCRSSSSSSSSRSSSSSSCRSSSSSSSSSCRSSSSSSCSSSSSSSRSSSSSSRSSSSSSSSSRSSSSSSSSSNSSSSSSSSSCRSSSSSSSSRSSSSSSRSSSSSSSSSSCRSSSSSSRSSSSSCRSSSSSCSSMSHLPFKALGIDKISSTITFEQSKSSEYVSDVDSDLKTIVAAVNAGFKPYRVTTAQRDALTTLYPGLIIFNVSTNKLNFYTGTAWEAITSA